MNVSWVAEKKKKYGTWRTYLLFDNRDSIEIDEQNRLLTADSHPVPSLDLS